MKNWQCPIESLDEDIREVVRILYENNMRPYASCSGSYKDHEGGRDIPENAYVLMLDSELARELIAILINDKRFKCSISKEDADIFFDNQLPRGIRFGIDFENICGDTKDILLAIIQEMIEGRRANPEDRQKIDAVCKLLDTFDVSYRNAISFSFNDEFVISEKEEKNNYSIRVSDKRDLEDFYEEYGESLEGFIQTEYECRFFSDDYITMLAFLKKISMEYPNIPKLKRGQMLRRVVDKNRFNKFMHLYHEKVKQAEENIHAQQIVSSFDITESMDDESLFKLFSGEDMDEK